MGAPHTNSDRGRHFIIANLLVVGLWPAATRTQSTADSNRIYLQSTIQADN